MTQEQTTMFGELEGLFADPIGTLPITPRDEVQLVASCPAVTDHPWSPMIGGRWGDLPADSTEGPCSHAGCGRLFGDHAPGDDDPEPDELAPGVETTRDRDREPIRPDESAADYDARIGDDPDGPEGIGRCASCGEAVLYEDGASTRWGPLHDGCNEPDRPGTDPDGEPWTPERPPSLGELIREGGHAPWAIRLGLEADTDTEAAAALRSALMSSGSYGPRGGIDRDSWGIWLHLLGTEATGSTRTKLRSWATFARELRAAATPEILADLQTAAEADRRIDDAHDKDPRPWLRPGAEGADDPAIARRYEVADAAWHKRSERRYQAAAIVTHTEREILAELAARADADAAAPPALF